MFIYVQENQIKKMIKKNKAWELNHLLVSSLPTPVSIANFKSRGLALLQFEKGLPITAETWCAFPFHYVGDPT